MVRKQSKKAEWKKKHPAVPPSTATNGDADQGRPSQQPSSPRHQWLLSSLALFGDSGAALTASFVLFMVAVGISLVLDPGAATSTETEAEAYRRLGPIPLVDPPTIFLAANDDDYINRAAIARVYRKDGVVAVRGLIDDPLLAAMDRQSAQLVLEETGRSKKKKGTQFHTVVQGAMFRLDLGDHSDDNDEDGALNKNNNNMLLSSAFLQVALSSRVSTMAAELLQSTGELQRAAVSEDKKESNSKNSSSNLRVMRDILLTKDDDAYICGWHVDDFGFWPATPDAPGINAWIALDDMPVEYGGGFALAVGSHQASWRDEAHFVTGASTTFPAAGYTSAADMFAKRTGSGTCNLKRAAPHLHRRMEEIKRIYPVKRGDVIFHTRWLFHRTVSFEREYVSQQQQQQKNNLVYRRYSIRYSPGSATVPPGYGTELSVLWDERNGGKSADSVCQRDGPWYPQAYPTVLANELQGLASLVRDKIPVAEERRAARKQEMKPYLKKLAQEQHQLNERPSQRH